MKQLIGSIAQDNNGVLGIITHDFNSWCHLKESCDFVTFVDDVDTEDPRDLWIFQQNTPVTLNELRSEWATIKHFSLNERCIPLGCEWIPINRVTVVLSISNN